MLKFVIQPFDVLFFRDSRPFNAGDTARSIFPPFPHTFAGAICSVIYQHKKVKDPQILKNVYGPFLYFKNENKIYFPKPADIYSERKKGKKTEKLFPLKISDDVDFSLFKFSNTNKPNEIDKLPLYKGQEEVEPFEGLISEDGLQRWINGDEVNKSEIKGFGEIFEYEERVGIRQNLSVHTVVEEDGLYRIRFLRLKDGWSFVFYAEFDCEKLPDELNDENKIKQFYESQTPRVLKLGGEMKNAYYKVEIGENISSKFQKPNIKDNRFKILFLTPGVGVFNSQSIVPPNLPPNLRIVSACVSGFINIGIRSEKLKVINFVKRGLKAGSVFYVEKKDDSVNLDRYWFGVFPEDSGSRENEKNKENEKNNKKLIGTNLVIYGKL